MANVNCLRCHFRHEDNGNCTAVGGFCTAAPAAHCPHCKRQLGLMVEEQKAEKCPMCGKSLEWDGADNG